MSLTELWHWLQIEQIVDTFPSQSIDFFGALRSRVYDNAVRPLSPRACLALLLITLSTCWYWAAALSCDHSLVPLAAKRRTAQRQTRWVSPVTFAHSL